MFANDSCILWEKLSMECIHQLCVYSQNGTTMLSLKKAAEVIGFKTLGVKVNLLTLAEDIPLPCILYWRQEHFVVLYEVRKKEVIYIIMLQTQ